MKAIDIVVLSSTLLLLAASYGVVTAQTYVTNTKYDEKVFQFLMYYQQSMHYQQSSMQIVPQQSIQTHRETQEDFKPTTKDEFIKLCTDYLLGEPVISDNQISNLEAASFFEYLCTVLDKPSCKGQSIPFHSLSLNIQMSFVSAICPTDFVLLSRSSNGTSSDNEPSCIDVLREQVELQNAFGYNITEDNQDQVEEDMTNYCSNVYGLSSDFHYGTYAPSPTPSLHQPTISPYPTKTPVVEPSMVPSIYQTVEPSVTAGPTSLIEYRTAFTYMMGFDNEDITSTFETAAATDTDTADSTSTDESNDNQAVDILNQTSDAIIIVLTTLSNSTGLNTLNIRSSSRTATRRHLQIMNLDFTTQNGNGVQHLYQQKATCTEDFTESSHCVVIVSEVSLQSSSKYGTISKELVSNVIYDIMKLTIGNDSFRRIIDIDDIIEIKYISDGNTPPAEPEPTNPDVPIGIGDGYISVIVVGSVLFVILLAFFVGRSRRRSEDRSIDQDELSDDDYLNPDEDDVSSNSSNGSGGGSNPELISKDDNIKSRSRQLPLAQEEEEDIDVENQNENDNEDLSLAQSGLQFDVATGDVVGSAAVSYSESYKSIGSGYSADDPETPSAMGDGDVLVDKLDEAVHAGDWAAVAAIAGDLSQADDISTMSSLHSRAEDISYAPSERSSLAPKDAERAAKIDKLISEGDWNAVGATAAAFENEMSEDSPEKKSNSSQESPKRGKSLLDFISGPWQSKAASKAVVESDENADIISSQSDPEAPFAHFENRVSESETETEDDRAAPFTNFNDGLSASDPSDLSAGEPKSPTKRTETLVALGTVGVAGAAAAAVYHSESDTTTDDDQRLLISPSQKKKRGWAGRFLRRKNDDKKKNSPSSLALQEDSSVSSWSKGEESSPENTLNPYGIAAKPADDMPPEMRAFGEDHGLAVAERAIQEEDERKQRKLNESSTNDSGSELSQKSSNSLRDELDKAIETGDWAAVEKQTNEMLDAENNNKSNVLSELDSDVDSDALDGWSHDGGGLHTDNESEAIDDDRIEMLEKLIETDDWQGIVDDSQIHSKSEGQ